MPFTTDHQSKNYVPRIISGAAALISIVIFIIGWFGYQSFSRYEQRAHTNVRNLSLLVERDIGSEFDRIDLALRTAVNEVQHELSEGGVKADRLQQFLIQEQKDLPEIISLRVTDAKGAVLYGQGVEPGAVNLSDREFFAAQVGNQAAGLSIAAPVFARISKEWVIPVSRRIKREDGTFGGIVYANIPVKHFVNKFAALDLGPTGLVTLRSAGHVSVARYPAQQEGGGVPGQVALSDQLRRLLQDNPASVTYVAPSPTDHIERVFGYTKLKSYPLYVVVGQGTEDYRQEWRQELLQRVGLALLFVVVVAVLVGFLIRAWRRQEENSLRWSLALESGEFSVWDWDLSTGKVLLSKRGKALFGFADNEIGNNIANWMPLYHPDDLLRMKQAFKDHFRHRTPSVDIEYRARAKDGRWKWFRTRGIVVKRAEDGRPLRMIGTHVDRTERREREDSLRLSSSVFEMANEAMVITDSSNNILQVNPTFTAITGYAPEEVIGRNPRMLSAKTHSVDFYEEMWRSLKTTNSWSGEVLNRRKDGEVYVEWLSLRRVLDANGTVQNHFAVFSDISERKAAEKRIRHLALHDPLTDLPNRSLLTERLQQSLIRAERDKVHVGLIYFDLDKFKPVNDNYGHQIGDLLLKEIALRVRECVRASDTVARIGGDEFVVLLPVVEGDNEAVMVAEKIRHSLAQPFEIYGHPVQIGSSLGVAVYPDHGTDETTLTQHADEAMYQAKQGGRDRVVLYQLER